MKLLWEGEVYRSRTQLELERIRQKRDENRFTLIVTALAFAVFLTWGILSGGAP